MSDAVHRVSATHVVVVDDDTAVRGVIKALLEREGYRVDQAAGTTEALEILDRERGVELVVTDMHMPGRDGRELLREMRAHYPEIAVVMVTGDGDLSTAIECLKLGARDYLTKPLAGAEVRARVAKALAESRMAVEMRRLRGNYQGDLERRVSELGRKNKAMFLAQVQMAVTMLEAKDPYTRGHSQRVAEYAVATGRQMGLDQSVLEELRLGGELHDIGKIGTRDVVLHKPGPLTPEEFAHMREHTLAGESMLSMLRDDHPEVLRITRSHHERVDGTGFPDGLEGDQIPLTARIVSVVDAFDAMTSSRTYRKAQGAMLAMEEIRRCSGSHFDPAVVAAFFAAYPDPAVLANVD